MSENFFKKTTTGFKTGELSIIMAGDKVGKSMLDSTEVVFYNYMIIDRNRFDEVDSRTRMILDHVFICDGPDEFTVWKDRTFGRTGEKVDRTDLIETWGSVLL